MSRGPRVKPPPPIESDASSRDRILLAAKALFSRRGYEGTTTVAIARAAGTSESQMMKHFGGKEGILEAIFDEGWREVLHRVPEALDEATTPLQKLQALVLTLMNVFQEDPDLRSLMLLEGRRVRRGERAILLTEGYRQFTELLDSLLLELREAGLLRSDLPLEGIRSALVGAFENLQRDHMLQVRAGADPDFAAADIAKIVGAVIGAFLVTG